MAVEPCGHKCGFQQQTHLQYLNLRISLEESKVRNILLNWI